MIFEIIFWSSIIAIFHSYIFYPLILYIYPKKIYKKLTFYLPEDELPIISILISAYNEEEVIKEKIESIYKTNYPVNKIELIIGSDKSTDNTNNIINKLKEKYSDIQFFPYKKRQGKINIINNLVNKAKGEIYILTDANVIFNLNTLYELVKYFKNPNIGLVDTNMINIGLKKEGISVQEKTYITREVKIKNLEGKIWGTMMGPFGGCFAIRKELYSDVPSNFLVDDFYLNMKVLEKSKMAINNVNAKVYEDVSNNLRDEFRRKVRIATGNFQNLVAFKHLLWHPVKGLSFSFISHKVLRWLGPFFLLSALISNIFIFNKILIYNYLLYIQIIIYIIPIIDYLLRKIKIHVIFLRFITHFISMNIALLTGFIKFHKGVKTNIWQPTKRNQ